MTNGEVVASDVKPFNRSDLVYPFQRGDYKTEPFDWIKDGVCAETDPEAFFPEQGESVREAKRICTTCTVGAKCIQYALQNDQEYGVWGGYSNIERQKLKTQYGSEIDDETAFRLFQEQRAKILRDELMSEEKRINRSQRRRK